MRRALVRRPGPRIAHGIVTHIERQSVDGRLAREQWEGYVRAMESAGWETIEVPGGEDFPDGAFIEDTMVVYKDLAVIARPGAEARRPEVPDAEKVVEIGYPPLVDDPSAFPRFVAVPEESGSHVVLLGENRLLMAADCLESAALFASMGYEPVTVDIGEFQKLEGCVTCLSIRLRGVG